MSSVNTQHPLYIAMQHSWQLCRDFAAGEEAVKAKGATYLPPTEGMILDGFGDTNAPKNKPNLGQARYNAYRLRTPVPDYVSSAVEVMTGLMHAKPAIIQLPTKMEYLRDRASMAGERLGQLYRRMTSEQIVTGRLGLLADMSAEPVAGAAQIYLSLYKAESIVNWDDGTDLGMEADLQFVSLDESGLKRDAGQFSWQYEESYRILQKLDGVYKFGVFTGSSAVYAQSDMKAPLYMSKPMETIPFVFINSTDLLAAPQQPPLKRLADLCQTIYMGEADYRQQLHNQSQDTLVVIGGTRSTNSGDGQDDALRVGAGARIDLDINGDAKYIGVSSEGLEAARTAIENDRKRAQVKSGELIQNNGSQMESGTALSTRFNAQTASLNQLARTSAAGLESALRKIAIWMGENPEDVQVEPNLEFVDFALEGQNFLQLMQAKKLGMPLSYETLHELAADRGLTTTDFNTEIARITKEKALGELLAPTPEVKEPSTNDGGNNDPANGGG